MPGTVQVEITVVGFCFPFISFQTQSQKIEKMKEVWRYHMLKSQGKAQNQASSALTSRCLQFTRTMFASCLPWGRSLGCALIVTRELRTVLFRMGLCLISRSTSYGRWTSYRDASSVARDMVLGTRAIVQRGGQLLCT